MHLKKALVFLLASLSLVAAGSHRKGLRDYCTGLRRMMAFNKDVYTNADAALREAQRYLKSILGTDMEARFRLSRAWEAVVHDGLCRSSSAEYVAIIADCNPASGEEMRTLYDATSRYTKKCLTAHFWDEKLRKKLGKEDKTGLSKFMNKEFLDQYRMNNARERELHFATIGGENCCQADRSHGALLKVLEPIAEAEKGRSAMSIIRSDRLQLEQLLKKHLFKPCERYLSTMHTLMRQAKNAHDYSGKERGSFIKSLSQDFQDAIFRYKYCECFQYQSSSNGKLSVIGIRGFQ